MKIQFATFEALISIQLVFLALLFITTQTNTLITNSNYLSDQLRSQIAIEDIISQFSYSSSLQRCLFYSEKECLSENLTIFKNIFHLHKISLRFNEVQIGNFSTSTMACFWIDNLTYSKNGTLCISLR